MTKIDNHEDDNEEGGGDEQERQQDDNDHNEREQQQLDLHHQQQQQRQQQQHYMSQHYGAVAYGGGEGVRYGQMLPPPYGSRSFGDIHHQHHPSYMSVAAAAAAAAAAQYNEEYAHRRDAYIAASSYPEHYNQHPPYGLHMMHPGVAHLQHFHPNHSDDHEEKHHVVVEQNDEEEVNNNNRDNENDGDDDNDDDDNVAVPDEQEQAESNQKSVDDISERRITEKEKQQTEIHQKDDEKNPLVEVEDRKDAIDNIEQSVDVVPKLDMRIIEEDDDDDNQKENVNVGGGVFPFRRVVDKGKSELDDEDEEEARLASIEIEEQKVDDPLIIAQNELIEKSTPSSELEKALYSALQRKQAHLSRLASEIVKLKQFISKRKQTYKRKRKDDGAPIRPLSAYNIFIQDRFARLAKENEIALKSDDEGARLQRVPAHNLVAATGNKWKELSIEEKQQYEIRARKDKERYEQQMSEYKAPPDKISNQKRSKTGYNMFFSAHVIRMKQTEEGVPSERGSVARIVGIAWKDLTAEERAYYDREAEKYNASNAWKDGDDDDEEDDIDEAATMMKRLQQQQQQQHHQQQQQQQHQQQQQFQLEQYHLHQTTSDPHLHALHAASIQQQHGQADPRHHPYYTHPHLFTQPPPYGHYDYSQQQHRQHQQLHGRGPNFQPPYSMTGGRHHPYEGTV